MSSRQTSFSQAEEQTCSIPSSPPARQVCAIKKALGDGTPVPQVIQLIRDCGSVIDLFGNEGVLDA